MKRKNFKTQKPFKMGDIRADGKVFREYTKTLKSTGFFRELWVTPESLKRKQTLDMERKQRLRPKNPARLPYGSAKLFKNKPKAVALFRDFAILPPTKQDWIWLEPDMQFLRQYFTT